MFGVSLSNVVFPASLTSLDFNHNRIFGSLPVELTALEFQFLNVTYNRLCGKIPMGEEVAELRRDTVFSQPVLV